MSEAIEREIQDLLRQKVIRATGAAAEANSVSIHAGALALLSQPDLFFVNAPISGLEMLDLGPLLDGSPALDDMPVMYWHVSYGHARDGAMPIAEGYYTVIARRQRGTVSLRDAHGTTVAAGHLEICIEPQVQPVVAAKTTVSGGIDGAKVDLLPPHLKICGHVKVTVDGKSVTISACIDVGI